MIRGANFVGTPYSGLGRTFVGGLLTSTTLTLVVVPLFYTLLDDVADHLAVLVRGRARTPLAEPGSAPSGAER